MFLIDQLILLGGVLLVIGIVSSKLSARLGLPVLVLFLAVGMLAGEDGPGGIDFDDFVTAHAIGTLALAIILFDGGLQTRTAALAARVEPAVGRPTLWRSSGGRRARNYARTSRIDRAADTDAATAAPDWSVLVKLRRGRRLQ